MKIEDAKKRTVYHVHCVLIICIMLFFGFLPPIGPITPYGMQVLGVFIGCVYAWLIGQYIWPSVFALIVLGFMGNNTVAGILSSAYGNNTVLMILWALIFCYVMISCGMIEVVSNAILSSKLATRGPWALAFFLCLASTVAAVFANSMAVTLFVWFIFYGIMEKLDIPKFSPYSSVVLVMITIFSYSGHVIMPYAPSTQIVLGLMSPYMDISTMNWLNYILFWVIFNACFLPLSILFCKYVLRIKAPFTTLDDSVLQVEKKPLTTNQKVVLAYLAVLIFFMVVPDMLPAGNPLKVFNSRLGITGLFIVINVLMAITFVKEHSLNDIEHALKSFVPWKVYFLVATALTISPLLTSADTGIGVLLNGWMGGLLGDKSALVFTLIILALGLVVTNIINNGVTMALLIPITFTFSQVVGANFVGICVMYCGLLLMGVVMPSGSGLAALMHGNNDYLKSSDVYKYASLLMIPFLLTFYFVGIPLTNVMF